MLRQAGYKRKLIAHPEEFDFDQWMDRHAVVILKTKPDGTYEVACPGTHGDYDKRDGRAFLKQMSGGGISMGCLHESCSLFHETGNHWREFRAAYEGREAPRSTRRAAPLTDAIPRPAREAAKWPESMAPESFHGLAGEFVNLVGPQSEADPASLLIQMLVGFGSMVGPSPYFVVEDTRHHVNLFNVIVGLSSKSRKGTSLNRAKSLLKSVDPVWSSACVHSGLSSGEGLIELVRDPLPQEAPEEGKKPKTPEAPKDRRALITQGEFCFMLAVPMERQGNTLSTVLRNAWDAEVLESLTRKDKAQFKATGAHISIAGHITADELRARLTGTDAANGFANRFLWTCARRVRELPEGGSINLEMEQDLVDRVARAAEIARGVGLMVRTDDGRSMWRDCYHDLSKDIPGLLGAVTSRAEAQVLRLSMIYALLDGKAEVDAEHLLAALSVWDYCLQSARYIFGDALGDPVADQILAALRDSEEELSRSRS